MMPDAMDSKLGDANEKTLGGKGKKNDFIGKYKWWIVGALAVIAVVVFLIVNKNNSQSQSGSASGGNNPAVDPATGMPYATEYGLGGFSGAGTAGIAGQTGAQGPRGPAGSRGKQGKTGKTPTPWQIAEEVWKSNHHGKTPTQHEIWQERVKLFGKMNPKTHSHKHKPTNGGGGQGWGHHQPAQVTGHQASITSHAQSIKRFSNVVIPERSMRR